MNKKSLSLLTVLSLISLSISAPAEDLVPELKDMAQFNTFKLYSGYLPILSTTKSLHYMFVQSQSKTTDPVIVWFNGGPGCSSVLGFAQEHGPYVMEDGATTFTQNEYSWNKEANMLYIESPAGVGYSMCTQNECSFTDDSAANDNLNAILYFFEQKFPEYQANDLYISGESFAGIYVPLVSEKIDVYNFQHAGDQKFKPNLKGFIVGNGCTNFNYDQTGAYLDMAYWHGLYDAALYQRVLDNNCIPQYSQNYPQVSTECRKVLSKFMTITKDINVYDVYGTCWPSNEPSFSLETGTEKKQKKGYTAKDYTPFLTQFKQHQDSDETPNLQTVPHCVYGGQLVDYFNDPTVKTQLHIPGTYTDQWDICTDDPYFQYNADYEKGSQWVYEAFQGKYKMLFYSGDTDGAVPTYGSMQWIKTLGWSATDSWRTYKVNNQVGGYIETYQGGLTFATVNGAGHMAPQWKRPETYYLVFNWIKGLPI